jgi:hypothetical protein
MRAEEVAPRSSIRLKSALIEYDGQLVRRRMRLKDRLNSRLTSEVEVLNEGKIQGGVQCLKRLRTLLLFKKGLTKGSFSSSTALTTP